MKGFIRFTLTMAAAVLLAAAAAEFIRSLLETKREEHYCFREIF
jgi:hypothetical protein